MPEYLEALRHKIGHDPVLVPCATVAVVRDGRVLLQKRRDNGLWGLHGGAMDMGEAPEAAARRELLEETGLSAGALRLWRVYAGPEHHYIYPNGDEVYAVDVVYLCEETSGSCRPRDGEVTELRWFAWDALPNAAELMPLDAPILRDLAAALGGG